MRTPILAVLLTFAATAPAAAEAVFPAVTDSVVRRECSDCHMLYPPEMLTQKAWTRIIEGLSDHFGENATLAPDIARRVLDYHLANAADVTAYKDAGRFLRGVDPNNPPIRITDTQRWRRKHDRISPEVFQRANVKFKGNCVACHRDAPKGDYDPIAENLMYQWIEK